MDLVQQRIRTLEAAADIDRVAHESPFEAFERRLAGKSREFDVAETVQRESRLPDFLAAAFGDVGVALAGRLLVSGVQRPISIDESRMAQCNRGPPGPASAKPRPAGEVLAEIVNIDPVAQIFELQRLDGLHDSNRRQLLRDQLAAGRLGLRGVVPAGIIVAGTIPAGLFSPGVVVFAMAYIVRANGPLGNLPTRVRRITDDLTVVILDVHLQPQDKLFGKRLSGNRFAARTPPAVA